MESGKRIEMITARAIVAVLFLVMALVGLTLFSKVVLHGMLGVDHWLTRLLLQNNPHVSGGVADTDTDDTDDTGGGYTVEPPYPSVEIDWERLYPLPEDTGRETPEEEPGVSAAVKADEEISFFEAVKTDVEHYTQDYLFGYVPVVEAAARMEDLLGWVAEDPARVYQLERGYWVVNDPKTDVTAVAEAVRAFDGYLRDRGTAFLYLQAPGKICREDTAAGRVDFGNQNADELLRALGEGGVEIFDLREALHDEGLDHHAMFFKTDHHWTPAAGMWAAGRIHGYLNDRYGYAIDPGLTGMRNYRETRYEEIMLGSRGREATLARAAPEGISLYHPLFETEFSLTIPSNGIDRTGDFDIFYFYKHLEWNSSEDYYTHAPYYAYLNGDPPVVVIRNHLLDTGRRALLIKDSFADVTAPFLAGGFSELHMLDIRHFTGSVEGYIEAVDPDIVLLQYSTAAISSEYPGMWDFR